MVDIKKSIKELQNEIEKKGDTAVYLHLICNNYKNLGKLKFTLSFDEYHEPGLMSVFASDLVDNLPKKNIRYNKLELEDFIRTYGHWYEILSEYFGDYDQFDDVPVDIVVEALSLIPFDSYEVIGHYPINKDYLYG